ncbi:Cupredoxin [Armillaria luteobubalina]|uniref:Cupredoxin n=1 Tax=Armillaria luteobubalina TaxID=153913 RepID=A0AA39UW92_9AGAR|nr:Cupredoxin [Armillaria luteobubalina]
MFFLSLGLALVHSLSVSATVYDVQVGGADGKLVYDPEAISAQPGDQVVFHFNPKNHTVTQSSFADPCGPKEGGLDSGFMPVAANSTDSPPTWTMTVNDTQPIWVYCKQAAKTPASHCGQGMVFAVNCGQNGTANSFTNFKSSALAVGASLSAAASAATASSDAASTTWTAAYGSVTVPPAADPTVVTDTITLSSSIWTTTYSSYPESPAATPGSLEGNIIKVSVGGSNQLVFNPSRVSAQPRDIIMFEFESKNHTVTQSSFADPCRRLNANGTIGFDSGFHLVTDNATLPTFNITVNDTAPIWAYCRQTIPASHCGAGMVFAINSNEQSARNFSAFQSLAEQLNGTASTNSSTTNSSSAAGGYQT